MYILSENEIKRQIEFYELHTGIGLNKYKRSLTSYKRSLSLLQGKQAFTVMIWQATPHRK